MTVEKARALVAAGFFCLVAALGGVAQAAELYPGCAQPGPTGKVWWVDPVNGKTPADGGDGSQAHPWNALQGVLFFKFPQGYARPLLSSVPYYHVVEGKRVYVADQLGSPPVQPGDTIMLMSGNYGDIVIGDYSKQVVNPSFVTVEAASGQTPVFSTLYIRSTNKWVFKGIKVQSLLGTNNNKLSLVTVTDQGAALPTSDIILQNMQVSTADSTDGWTKAQWVAQGRSGYREEGTASTGANGELHDLRLDDRVAHPERALRRGDLRQQFVVLEQRDRPLRRRRDRLCRKQYLDHSQLPSTTTSTLATATTKTRCKGKTGRSQRAFPITPFRTS